jgi:hypothetical protein
VKKKDRKVEGSKDAPPEEIAYEASPASQAALDVLAQVLARVRR